MAKPEETYGRGARYAYAVDRYHRRDLSVIREQYAQVSNQLFEVCCKLQREFDFQDLDRAAVLVAELRVLKACTEALQDLDPIGS